MKGATSSMGHLLMLLAGAGRCLIRPRSVPGVPAPKNFRHKCKTQRAAHISHSCLPVLFLGYIYCVYVCMCETPYPTNHHRQHLINQPMGVLRSSPSPLRFPLVSLFPISTSAATVRGVTARVPQGPDVEAPLIWHLGFNGNEEIQEVDYVEAEVESTDTVEPHLDELFGEKLLIAKFCLADALDKPTSLSNMAIVGSNEMTTPPGTVINKQAKRRTSVILRSIGKNINKTQQSLQSANVKMGDSFKRPDSQQTFVLENSRRRPLVARDPFKIGFVFK
ncbi:unnamed protein product [Cercopithifilaria johnstoni]|uniref:Uncharacterized protein n=1 Tax=Cercopithifilaria johnstoni TaxID=2874296 RepID=A0A8J2LU12_9BILA|nr:unnamed protein product [Cercopithifilaria johnstoni]